MLGRVRAGVIEQVTMDPLDEAGVGERMHRDGPIHGGVRRELRRAEVLESSLIKAWERLGAASGRRKRPSGLYLTAT